MDRFLRAGASEDASPIRSFEVTGETLATAFPDIDCTADEAESAFRETLLNDSFYLYRALRGGWRRRATEDSPNCFAYLCMSLLIDTLLDGEYRGQGQYRDRLSNWLGTWRTMADLSGLAMMWRDLVKWLDKRIAAGEDYRKLILPDPRSWTQIGYTRRLSFPERSDVRFLERVLSRFWPGISDPPGLIRAIEGAIHRENASWGMEAAFAEFRDAFRSGGASSDHRFWQLVLRAANSSNDVEEAPHVRLMIEFDEDRRLNFNVDGVPVQDLETAMQCESVVRSANLSLAAKRGIVFFRQTGMARWVAESDPPPGPAHVGLASQFGDLAGSTPIEFETSGSWILTVASVSRSGIDDLLHRLRLAGLRREGLITIGFEGGVRTGGGYLGRRKFLPRINAGDLKVQVRSLSERGESKSAKFVGGALISETTISGRYEFSVWSGKDGGAPEWTRRVFFFADAQPHVEIGGAADRNPAIVEWKAATSQRQSPPPQLDLAWEDLFEEAADLHEAIYAAGRTGLDEAEIIGLISRVSSAPWDVLRAIQESGFASARRRAQWRGRVWTLSEPCLLEFDDMALVAGATCAAMHQEFRQVAEDVGGRPFRVSGPSCWSPPVVGASAIAAQRIAGILGWKTASPPAAPRLVPDKLETSELVAGRHLPVSHWDWDRRKFVKGPADDGQVSLKRYVHVTGRDHDQYRVAWPGGGSCHATRAAAIIQAHIKAEVPLFSVEGGMLKRLSAEGALPLEIAQWLRLRSLAGGGPCSDGTYVYPLGDVSIDRIAAALPTCIESAVLSDELVAGLEGVAAIDKSRRSNGRYRLRWSNGKVIAA